MHPNAFDLIQLYVVKTRRKLDCCRVVVLSPLSLIKFVLLPIDSLLLFCLSFSVPNDSFFSRHYLTD